MQRPTDRQWLWSFIDTHFGVALPHKVFTPGHSTPFEFVADAFLHPEQDVAAWANRSGGKTLGASILAALEFRFNTGLQARVLSGSEDQAKFLYEYWRQWCSGFLADLVRGDPQKLLTDIGGGKFEILAASPKKVHGGKVQRLFEDELDEIAEELYQDAMGMIDSRPGLPGRTVITSTWHRANGLMGKVVEACPDNGIRLHKWNVWESIANCPSDRHGNGPGCLTCPLGNSVDGKPGPCLAKAREIWGAGKRCGVASHGAGIYAIEDVIKVYLRASKGVWDSQYECKRPSVEGLVYPDFDPVLHGCDKAPEQLSIYRAIDWGVNVFICLWIGETKEGDVYVLDTYRAEDAILSQHARHINAHKIQNAKATYCDPAGRQRSDQTGKSAIQEFGRLGIPCRYQTGAKATNVKNGIELIRAALRPASGPPRLHYLKHAGNKPFVQAMQGYENRKVNGVWIDEPKDPQEWEHVPDALRYWYANRRMPAGVMAVGVGAR